jgi:hypothetical protein
MYLNFLSSISDSQKKYIPSSFFLDEKWIRVIEKSFKFKRRYLIFKNDNNHLILPFIKIEFLFKKIYISFPFSFNIDLSDVQENTIIKKIFDLKNKNIEVIIKSSFWKFNNDNSYFKSKFNYYVVNLKKNLSDSFSQNIKRTIKKNKDVVYKFVNKIDSNDFNLFYENYIFSSKKLETFFYPKCFFLNLFNECENNFYLLNAYKGSEYLGGHLILLDEKNSQAIYFCSSKSEVGKKMSIDKLLLKFSMDYCFKKKYNLFNLGKVSKKNVGLNRFKRELGAHIKNLNYFSLKCNNYSILDKNSLIKNLVKFFIKKTPIKIYILFNNLFFRFLSMY